MADWAFFSRERHEADHSASHDEAPFIAAVSHRSVAQRWNSVATRLGSAHHPHGSTTTTRAPAWAASETYSPSARESQGAPSITTVSGSGGFVRTMESAAAIVPTTLLPERGSANTGHRSRSASASTRSRSGGLGVSPPTMMIPRPCNGSASSRGGSRSSTMTAGPGRSGRDPGDPVRGSRNSRLRCTGPGPRGPWIDSAKARTASGLHVASCPSAGTPGAEDQRVAAAKRPTCSMVWGAPV